MSNQKIVELYFKEKSGAIEASIREEGEAGWTLDALSTYSTFSDRWKKAHAVMVFSKK